jgi:hypothetical protein
MKRYLILLMVGCISAQSFVRTAWTLHYQWNRAVYLKNCENRDKSDMHCDGKCYLKKQMAASENGDPKAPELPSGFRQIKDVQLFFEDAEPVTIVAIAPAEAGRSLPPFAAYRLPTPPLAGVFKPPAA